MERLPNCLNIYTVLHAKCVVEAEDPATHLPIMRYPVFARPCPVRPRHGFVESRVITGPDALLALVRETHAADPEGEVMITPVIPAGWNAVWAPGLITLGPGHAGATSGLASGVIRIPQVPVWSQKIINPVSFQIATDEVPYIEVVGCGDPVITQVRSGPAIQGARPDWVPREVTISKVLEPSPDQDLILWERLVQDAAKDPGAVIFHPNGSVTDHISVHARAQGIPLVTFPVEEGQVLTPTPTEIPPDPQAVLAGLTWGDGLDLANLNREHLIRIMLMGLHHSAAMSGPDGKWIGLAAAIMLRLGGIALHGEARHELNPKTPGQSFAWKLSRVGAYTKLYPKSLSWHRARIGRVVNTFRYGIFGAGYSCSTGGTGGMKWAACAMSLIPLFNAVRDLARAPSQAGVNALLAALNRAVHQAHNGGWWLNKFSMDMAAYTQIQIGDPRAIIQALPTLWKVGTQPGQVKTPARYATWPVTAPRPIKLIGEPSIAPLPTGIGIIAKARGLRNPLTIPIPLDQEPIKAAIMREIQLDISDRIRVLSRSHAKAGSKAPLPDGGATPLEASHAQPLWIEPAMDEMDPAILAYFTPKGATL